MSGLGRSNFNREDEERLIFGNFKNGGMLPPIDPFDMAKTRLFKMIHTNSKNINTNYARQILDNEKFDEVMRLLREGTHLDWEMTDMVKKGLHETLNIVDELHEKNGFQIAGSFFSATGQVLMVIPGVNVMWGTAAYAGGTLLSWIGDNLMPDTKNHLSDFRYNFIDNFEPNAAATNLPGMLKKYEDFDDKVEKFQEWMEEQESKIYEIERKISEIEKSRHCLQFWHLNNNYMGIVVYLGINGGTTLTTVSDNQGNFISPFSVSMHDQNASQTIQGRLEQNSPSNRMTYSKYLEVARGAFIISEMSLFALDSDVYDRMFSLQSFFQGTRLEGEILRTAILLYLQNGEC